MKFQCFCDISGWNLRSDYVLTHLSLEGMLAMDMSIGISFEQTLGLKIKLIFYQIGGGT